MPRNKTVAAVAVVAVLAISAAGQTVPTQHQRIAIVGATLIDVSNYGHSTNDITNSVVLVDEGKIVAVGSATQITIPSGSTRIDAHGEFLVPGLVDGFGALRTQAFANAYLYDGITTVYVPTVLPNGGGDGELKIVRNASPGPRLFLGAPMTGYSEQGADPSDKPMLDHRLHDRRLSNEQLIARVDQLADQGFRGVTISYDVWPDQVDVIVAESRRRGMATLADLHSQPIPIQSTPASVGYCATITISSSWLLLRCCWTAPITSARALPPPMPSARLTQPPARLQISEHSSPNPTPP